MNTPHRLRPSRGFLARYLPPPVLAARVLISTVAAARAQETSSDSMAFTVATEREAAARAIAEQRDAPNIKHIMSVDEWGNLPTLTLAEALQRLPRVVPHYYEPEDFPMIAVMWIGPWGGEYTRVNVDGLSVMAGPNRPQLRLDMYNAAMFETIELVVAQTPERRADSLGGQINLKTRSALSMSEKRRVNYNVAARWAPPGTYRVQQRKDHSMHPLANFGYLERFDAFGGKRNLGVSLHLGYAENVNQIAHDFLQYEATPNPVAFFHNYDNRTGLNHRLFTNASLRVDCTLSPRTRLTASLLYNLSRQPFNDLTRVNPWTSAASLATLQANGQWGGAGAVIPGFTKDRTEIRPVAGSYFDLEMARESVLVQNPTGMIGAEHDFGRLKLDYAVHWSNAMFQSGHGASGQGGRLTMRATGVGFILDKSNLDGQVFAQVGGRDVYDPASYTTNLVFTKADQVNCANDVSGRVNLSYAMPGEVPIQWKTGVDTQNQRFSVRQENPRRWNRAAGAPPLSGPLMPLTRFEEQHEGRRLPVFDPAAINKELSNPALWSEGLLYAAQQPYINRRIYEEGVDAAYLQGSARFGKLGVLTGVRVERVEVDAFALTLYRTTPVASEPDPVKRMALDYGGSTQNGSYTKLFPSLHLNYALSTNLKVRLSWAMTYGRHLTNTIAPVPSADTQARTVTAANPSLPPVVSKNTDLRFEYAFARSTGLVSFGIFEQRVHDFPTTTRTEIGIVPSGPDNGFEGNWAGYSLRAFASDGGWGRRRGAEISYRQQLSFLPGLLRGLGVAAHYTYFESKTQYTGQPVRRENETVLVAPHSGNARFTYTWRKFSAVAGVNYRPRIPFAGATSKIRSVAMVDAGVAYRIRPQTNVYLNATNLAREDLDDYVNVLGRVSNRFPSAMTLTVGMSGHF